MSPFRPDAVQKGGGGGGGGEGGGAAPGISMLVETPVSAEAGACAPTATRISLTVCSPEALVLRIVIVSRQRLSVVTSITCSARSEAFSSGLWPLITDGSHAQPSTHSTNARPMPLHDVR